MNIRKAYRYRLKPTRKQTIFFSQFAGCSRYVFNRGLAERQKVYEEEQRTLRYFDQSTHLTKWKEDLETAWLKETHSQVLQQSLKDLDSAFEHFFRRLKGGEKPGFPRFKCRGEHDAFRFPQGVKVKGDRVYLPKIGWVRFKKSREIGGAIKQTTVIREGDHWYVSFSCIEEMAVKEKVMPRLEKAVGIDVGIAKFATMAVGLENQIEVIENPRCLKRSEKKIKILQKHLSRKKKGSQNRRKCKRKLSRMYARLRFQRHDFVHQNSSKIVKNHDVICIEDLRIQKMLKKGSRGLNRAIGDAGWRKFFECLKYKAEERGKHLVEMDIYYPSTKMCSRCGEKQEMSLSQRVYKCTNCGIELDRDVNSAINMKAAGTTVVNACGVAR